PPDYRKGRETGAGGRNRRAGSWRSTDRSEKDTPSRLEGSPAGVGAYARFSNAHLWREPRNCGGSRRAAGGLRPAGRGGQPGQDSWGGGWGGGGYRAGGRAGWEPSPRSGRFLSSVRLPGGGRRGDRRKR